MAVVYFKVMSQNLAGRTKKTHKLIACDRDATKSEPLALSLYVAYYVCAVRLMKAVP
jgi:hypothetical protein